jgi:drug/metabolite transporter (DMT)-like permease
VVGVRPAAAGVAGALLIAFSAILVRLADVAPVTAAVFRCAYALPVLGALAWWERRRFGPAVAGDRRLVALAGVFFAADLIFWHFAIEDVGAGLATVLGNLQVALVPLIAWVVLSERPGGRVLAALPILLSGVLLISGALEQGAYGETRRAGSCSARSPASRTPGSSCCCGAATATIAGRPARCSTPRSSPPSCP